MERTRNSLTFIIFGRETLTLVLKVHSVVGSGIEAVIFELVMGNFKNAKGIFVLQFTPL